MSISNTIMVGTIIYAVLGVIGCIGFSFYVGKKSKNPQEAQENKS